MTNRFSMIALGAALIMAGCTAGNTGTTTTPSTMPSTMPSMGASSMPSASPSATQTSAMYFAADLTGANEVPAVATANGAGGAATATMSADGKTLTIKVWTTGLSGDLTGAHVHLGAAGESGDVVKGLELSADKRAATGTWMVGEGAGMLTAAHVANLKAGRLYVNAHTEDHPNGEVRGQLMSAGWVFAAGLSGSNEVPAVNTTANGVAWLTLSPDKQTAMIKVYTSGLSGDATGAHIHRGAAGMSGEVVFPLELGADKRTAMGTWRAGEGAAALTGGLVDDLVAGRLYVNVHTAAHPNGEVRGQLMLP